MAQATLAYVGLGSNLGDRQDTIRKAIRHLGQRAGLRVSRVSELRESIPLGHADQPAYVNGVAEVETELSAREFFDHLMDVERILGRERTEPWAARTIDLDLLLFGNEVIAEPTLKVPHAQMLLRHFVLQPLAELAPDLRVPGLAVPVRTLAARLQGHSYVHDAARPLVIAVAGNIGAGKTTLTNCLGPALGAEVLHEPYDTNPFLPQVYAGRQDLALDSQLYFLANRVDQLSNRSLAPGQVYVTDYVFEKEHIYAGLLLEGAQLDLYERLYPNLVQQVVRPSLVVYLRHAVAGCLERIHRRGRRYEQRIQEDFLHALDRAYEALLADWNQCPVLRLCVLDFDCMRDADLSDLVHQIQAYLGLGRHDNDSQSEGPVHAGR
jgi:2-amino-4-hydroxy-6-hydroxymethyldihydropteridine diphosphokinase